MVCNKALKNSLGKITGFFSFVISYFPGFVETTTSERGEPYTALSRLITCVKLKFNVYIRKGAVFEREH
jgi:hypothetical protein